MIEKAEVDATVSDLSGAAVAVPQSSEVDNAVCTDIAARDEVNPINAQAQRISDVRSRFENLGADMQHIMGLLYKLKDMSIGQQNLDAAGKTVDDIYARVIDLEAKLEELDDEVVKHDDFDPDNFVRDCDLEDRVIEILRDRVAFNVDVDIS